MLRFNLSVLVAFSLFAVVGLHAQTVASNEYAIYAGRDVRQFDQMIDELSKADVVFIGEQHDHKLGHSLELSILKALQAKNASMALSLEMFERDTQTVLDE